jgi:hypothetical protein
VTALGTAAAYRWSFRRALRKAHEEIDKMILALQQTLDRDALFGGQSPPPPGPLPGHADGDAAAMMVVIS